MYGHHRTTHPSNGHEFLAGVLVGAAIGAAVGVLLAPKSGAETREQVAASADRLRRQAGETYDKASAMMHDVVDRGRDAWHRGQQTFEEARDAAAREIENAEERMSQI